MATIEVRQYQTVDGRIPVAEWLDSFRDRIARSRVLSRLDRLTEGLRGDWKSLVGGTKRTQATDIEKARAYWKDFKNRSG